MEKLLPCPRCKTDKFIECYEDCDGGHLCKHQYVCNMCHLSFGDECYHTNEALKIWNSGVKKYNKFPTNCVFCKSDNVTIASFLTGEYYVVCRSCKAQGSVFYEKHEAIMQWNELYNKVYS